MSEITKGATVQFENQDAPLKVVQIGRWRVDGRYREPSALCEATDGSRRWYPFSSLRLTADAATTPAEAVRAVRGRKRVDDAESDHEGE